MHYLPTLLSIEYLKEAHQKNMGILKDRTGRQVEKLLVERRKYNTIHLMYLGAAMDGIISYLSSSR